MSLVSLKHVGLIVKASRGHGAAANACGEVEMGGDGGKLWRWEEMVESAKRRASVGRLLWNDTSLPLNLGNVDALVSIAPLRVHSAILRWIRYKVIDLIDKGVRRSNV